MIDFPQYPILEPTEPHIHEDIVQILKDKITMLEIIQASLVDDNKRLLLMAAQSKQRSKRTMWDDPVPPVQVDMGG